MRGTSALDLRLAEKDGPVAAGRRTLPNWLSRLALALVAWLAVVVGLGTYAAWKWGGFMVPPERPAAHRLTADSLDEPRPHPPDAREP